MKTTLDVVDIVFGWLSPTVFSDSLTGEVFKHKRPINSKLEDVVIAALAIQNQDLQNGIVNVNIHVPDIVTSSNGATDSQPNHVRLQQLATQIQPYLDKWSGNAGFDIQQQIMIEDPENGDHYINFRLNFYSINILN